MALRPSGTTAGWPSTSTSDDDDVRAANAAPATSVTFPADGAVFAWKPTITITAAASDSDGTIAKVEFLAGTTKLGEDLTAPYAHTWRNVPSGSQVLRARATDNAGAITTSAPATITVRPKR